MHYADFSTVVFKESAKVIFKGLSTKGNWEKSLNLCSWKKKSEPGFN